MSNGLNRAELIGNLGADPELKEVGNGSSVLRLRLAVSESYVDKNNERQERTEWLTCNVWGKRAPALNRILTKGRQVYVEGRIQTRSWDDKDGTKRYSTEVNVKDLILLGAREDGQARNDNGGGGNKPQRSQAPPQDSFGDDYGADEIPF